MPATGWGILAFSRHFIYLLEEFLSRSRERSAGT
jgi:hypothetical protein